MRGSQRTKGALALFAPILAFVALVALVAPIDAARADGVDLRTFRPALDPSGSLATEDASTPGPGRFVGGAWLSFGSASLRVRDAEGDPHVTVLGPQLLLQPTVALGLGRRFEIGASIPIVLAQGATSLASVDGGDAIGSSGLGGVTLGGKAVLAAPAPDAIGGLALALRASVTAPTGDHRSFVDDDRLDAEGALLADYDYGHLLLLRATAGYRWRGDHTSLVGVTIGDALLWGASIGLRPQGLGLDAAGRWTWWIEAHGEIGGPPGALFADKRRSPAFLGLSARRTTDSGVVLFGGAEGSLADALGAPAVRLVFGLSFAPAGAASAKDEDGDGVPDAIDECPGLPEDHLGPHPNDGCPDDSSAAPSAPASPAAPAAPASPASPPPPPREVPK